MNYGRTSPFVNHRTINDNLKSIGKAKMETFSKPVLKIGYCSLSMITICLRGLSCMKAEEAMYDKCQNVPQLDDVCCRVV